MAKTIEAVYEKGVFRPLEEVNLPEGRRVQLYIFCGMSDVTPEQREQLEREIRNTFVEWPEQDWAEFESTFKRGS